MRTRIEIYKNEEWIELFLGDEKQIKYNLLVNRVGSMSQREISHSNTFTLPYVHQNIQALDINIFNPRNLARAFNTKYIAKYYVNEKLSQEGFIVINNTENGAININFIDGALDIVEKWGSTSYHGLLNSPDIILPSPYKESVDIMKDYILSQNNIVTPLQNIEGFNFPIAKFPNNLNSIGDKFQKNSEGIRLADKFNPYQSRPIFNVKAFFEIAIRSFDYTPFYDESIDWEKLENTYLIEKGLSQSQKEGNSNTTISYPAVSVNSFYRYIEIGANEVNNSTLFVYPLEANALYPNSLTPTLRLPEGGTVVKDYKSLDRCIIVPDKNNLSIGTMNFKAQQTKPQTAAYFGHFIQGIWRRTIASQGYVFKNLPYTDNGDPTIGKVDITINRSVLLSPPSGAGEFIGVQLTVSDKFTEVQSSEIINMVYTETFLPPKVISYDIFDQYIGENIDLTHAAPRDITIKDLLSSILQKEGILLNFNNKEKIIKLFSYGSYIRKRNEGKFSDWGEYHQEYSSPLYNTDYGSEFAVINELGLLSPYKGNTYKLILANQIKGSKYKEYIESYNKKLKDVEAIILINNPVTPYFEYKNLGLGLIELGENLGQLTQCRAAGNTQGTFTGLTSVVNVNYSILPAGMIAWYDVVDRAVRAQATFLIPLNVIKNLDLSEPIYVPKLGGFYIIEEVEEYIDAQTPVRVKLIKLLVEDKQVDPAPLGGNYSSQYSNGYSK